MSTIWPRPDRRPLAALLLGLALGAAALPAGEPAAGWAERIRREPGAYACLGDLSAGLLYAAGDAAVGGAPVPAGSWVKPFLAYALLVHGRIDPSERHTCTGWQELTGRCWYGPGHGRLDVTGALAHSCNAWFNRVTPRLPPDVCREAIAPFFPAAWPAAADDRQVWAETFMAGRMTAASPSFTEWSEALTALVLGRQVSWPPAGDCRRVSLGQPIGDSAALAVVRAGLRAAAVEGTGRELALQFGSGAVWVKTSSSQSPYRDAAGRRPDEVCMVAAYWPAGQPRAFIALFVPRGMAATTAAPLAGAALRDFCRQRRLRP